MFLSAVDRFHYLVQHGIYVWFFLKTSRSGVERKRYNTVGYFIKLFTLLPYFREHIGLLVTISGLTFLLYYLPYLIYFISFLAKFWIKSKKSYYFVISVLRLSARNSSPKTEKIRIKWAHQIHIILWKHTFAGLKREPAADGLWRLRDRIPSGPRMSVCCECWMLSGRGLCDGPIPRAEESHRLWCVTVCDLETSWIRRPWPALGCCAREKDTYVDFGLVLINIKATVFNCPK